jgi:hypothetical protein
MGRLGGLRGLGRLGAVMVILLSVTGAVAWAQAGSRPTDPSRKDGPTRRSGAVSSAAPVRSSLGNDPVAAVGVIAEERAKALATTSTARLGSVDVSGSPAWRADAALVRALRGDGLRLVGLGFAVDEARLVRWAEDAAVVRVSLVTSEHRRNGPRGSVIVPEERAGPVDLVLVRISSGAWRLRSIEAVASPGSAGSGSGA